jgi:hypothetical protein
VRIKIGTKPYMFEPIASDPDDNVERDMRVEMGSDGS